MLKQYCVNRCKSIDEKLDELTPDSNPYSSVLVESMRYSLFAGGKRLRPILLMAAADAVGGNGLKYIHLACGLEMIHTYSLIHDDLPAMDNDDYRRGKLTSHKVYGEGMAILAGDALLTAAFDVMVSQPEVEPGSLLKVVHEISTAAGPYGMVGGQAVDLLSEGKVLDMASIKYMHQAKTGALFKAAIRAGAILAGGTTQQLEKLTNYADCFGLAFQITDDILDVTGTQDKLGKPIGSDIRNQKATYVTLYSLDEAKQMARQTVDKAIESLSDFGAEADVLREFVRYLLMREH